MAHRDAVERYHIGKVSSLSWQRRMQWYICKTRRTEEYHTAKTLQKIERNPCYELRDVPAITAPSESNTSTFRLCRGPRSVAIFSKIRCQVGCLWQPSAYWRPDEARRTSESVTERALRDCASPEERWANK